MTALSQAYGNIPVGAIVQSPFNLTDARFLPCDGRKLDRSAYPALSACVGNVGTFLPTARTRSAIPSNANVASATADSVNFCHVGGDGATQVYTSPDAITWTSRSCSGTSQPYSLASDGVTGMVAIGAGGGSYSSNSGVNWTAASGTPTCGAAGAIAYAPTIGANGRYLCVNSNGTSYFTSDDRGANWTTRSGLFPGGIGGYYYGCWTGQRFIIAGPPSAPAATVYASDATGISSWTSIRIGARYGYGRVVSDGNGKVAMWDASGSAVLYYSLDHGATWSHRFFGALLPNATTEGMIIGASGMLSYANGKFFLAFGDATPSNTWDQNFWASSDLVAWTALDLSNPYGAGVVTQSTSFIYKAGVYFANDGYTPGSGMSLVEDTTKIQLPNGIQGTPGGAAATATAYNNYQPFIRVK